MNSERKQPEEPTDKPNTLKEPSAEYQNFEKALKHVLTIPKAELDRRLKADKKPRRK